MARRLRRHCSRAETRYVRNVGDDRTKLLGAPRLRTDDGARHFFLRGAPWSSPASSAVNNQSVWYVGHHRGP